VATSIEQARTQDIHNSIQRGAATATIIFTKKSAQIKPSSGLFYSATCQNCDIFHHTKTALKKNIRYISFSKHHKKYYTHKIL